jgi:hypothetical protein
MGCTRGATPCGPSLRTRQETYTYPRTRSRARHVRDARRTRATTTRAHAAPTPPSRVHGTTNTPDRPRTRTRGIGRGAFTGSAPHRTTRDTFGPLAGGTLPVALGTSAEAGPSEVRAPPRTPSTYANTYARPARPARTHAPSVSRRRAFAANTWARPAPRRHTYDASRAAARARLGGAGGGVTSPLRCLAPSPRLPSPP